MVNHVLHPGEVGVVGGWKTVFPAGIRAEDVLPPIGLVKWRVRDYEIGFEVGVRVF